MISDSLATRRHGQPWLIVGLPVLCLVMGGCPLAWQQVSINRTITPEDVAFVIPGKTTLAEIVASIGTPNEISALDGEGGDTYAPFGRRMVLKAPHARGASHNRAIVRYWFLDMKRFRVNFTWGLQFVLTAPGAPDDAVLEGGGIGTDEFLIIFDSNWIVQRHAFAKHVDASRYRYLPFDLEPPDDNQVVSF